MWTQTSLLLLLLLACCLWPGEAQSDGIGAQNIWDDPIKFKTKTKDSCTMAVTGYREYTKLRVACESINRSYWCDFLGKPQTCRQYNKNPRHYFVQMMWGFRKLRHACNGPRRIKPHMCRDASDESQMIFSTASFYKLREGVKEQPARRQHAPYSARRNPKRPSEVPPVKTTPEPLTPPAESTAKGMAHRYCWRSLHGVCSYVIGLFRKD